LRHALLCAGLLLGLLLVADAAPADTTPPTIPGSTGPANASGPPPAAVQPACDQPSPARVTGASPVSVAIDRSTAWQPRGGEVLIAVSGPSTAFAGLSVLACFGWSDAPAQGYFSAENLRKVQWQEGFVSARPSQATSVMSLGIIVPPLPSAPSNFWERWGEPIRSAGLGLVPVADLRLIGYGKDGVLFDEVRPVGITSIPVALIITLLGAALAIIVLYALSAGLAGLGIRQRGLRASLRAALSGRWILTLIKSSDGRASLSAFQILLWSFVVAASAVYVMVLSGTLINVTTGTLTLLGIAGAAGVMAAAVDQPTGAPPVPAPAWRDLVIERGGTTPDVSRIQMLLFTVVSAAFVLLQVSNYYVIPDIPAGYLVLMGISNGVYVGRKLT
jgi:hypothetical protein